LQQHPQYHSWRTISDLEAAASLFNNMGSYHYLKGNGRDSREVAELHFSVARKLYPEYAQVHNNLGVLAMRDNDYEKAEEYFRKSLELRPGYFAAYQNLSAIYMNQNRLEEAINLLKKAVAEEPRNQYAFINLAKLQIRQKNYIEAEENLKNALDIKKNLSEARHVLSRLYIITGRTEEAKGQLLLALKHNSEDMIAKSKMQLIEELAVTQTKIR
jgi:tetratricopeptide (TPR) repeat protein